MWIVPGAAQSGAVAVQESGMAESERVRNVAANLDFATWMEAFRRRAVAAGLREDVLDRALAGVEVNTDVLQRDRNQGEFNRAIWDYLDSAVSEARIRDGRKRLAEHAALFDRIETAYGVPREIVAAIWGLESAYGAVRGNIPTIEALATLAHDGRRAAFFESELIAALHIVQSGDIAPERMRGSWAGAMGHTQFMPSSWQAHAVDFDGDGRRDIWGDDPADALASTAAYLAGYGWRKGQPWGLEVQLPDGFDFALAGPEGRRDVAEWAALGLRPASGGVLPDQGMAEILLPAGARGPALMIFDNFRVIERYNPADAYVIAVGHLADRLAGANPFRAGWPREDRVLLAAERRELQEWLTRAGFDTQGVDGRIGPNTIAAIRAYQLARGLVPDGYASHALLEQLRQAGG